MGAFKSISFNIGRERLTKKKKQSDPGGRECNKEEMMSLTQSFSLPISATPFLFLCISGGSNNITVSNNKTDPRGYRCV